MGISQFVGADRFPSQGEYLGQKCSVCFDFDLAKPFEAEVIRDDLSEPFVMIFRLNDGRVVLSTECQYKIDGVAKFRTS